MTKKPYTKKNQKLSNCRVEIIEKGASEFFIDTKIKLPLKDINEFKGQCKKIKHLANEYYLDTPGMLLDASPIVIMNDLTDAGIKATKLNYIVVSITFFMNKKINHIAELNFESIENLIKEMSVKS